ncbi:MAG: D-alanyl-D-alanine carboxypeptidase [Anaerovoracaceae bacterium]|nr:D-alanyl-D-alanine carboxypeptidase [Anaerovoracaceae bacterium]
MGMKRKTRAAGMMLLVMLLAILIPSGAWAEEVQEDITPNAKAAILYETTTGTVLYEKNADMQLSPASMTKVMTAILVLEQNPELEGELTVDERAVSHYYCSSMEPMRHLYAGEVISYEDCLNYLLIPSGNEAGTAFAFELAGDMSEFAKQMTAKAKEIGCENTEFRDPTGISPYNITTPRDMAKIAEYALSFEKFREIVCKTEGTVPPSNKREKGFDYENTNALLAPNDLYENPYVGYIKGVKTGWTPAAGYCFTGCMEKDGLTWISVVMGIEDDAYAADGTAIRGDLPETVSLLGLTEGVTAEDLKKPVNGLLLAGVIIAGIVIAVIAAVLYRKKHRREM